MHIFSCQHSHRTDSVVSVHPSVVWLKSGAVFAVYAACHVHGVIWCSLCRSTLTTCSIFTCTLMWQAISRVISQHSVLNYCGVLCDLVIILMCTCTWHHNICHFHVFVKHFSQLCANNTAHHKEICTLCLTGPCQKSQDRLLTSGRMPDTPDKLSGSCYELLTHSRNNARDRSAKVGVVLHISDTDLFKLISVVRCQYVVVDCSNYCIYMNVVLLAGQRHWRALHTWHLTCYWKLLT